MALAVVLLSLADIASAACYASNIPALWPHPQNVTSSSCGVALNSAVTIVTGSNNDSATIDVIKAVVASAGGSSAVSSTSTGTGAQIVIGSAAENPYADAAANHSLEAQPAFSALKATFWLRASTGTPTSPQSFSMVSTPAALSTLLRRFASSYQQEPLVCLALRSQTGL